MGVPEDSQVPFLGVWMATSHFLQSGVVTKHMTNECYASYYDTLTVNAPKIITQQRVEKLKQTFFYQSVVLIFHLQLDLTICKAYQIRFKLFTNIYKVKIIQSTFFFSSCKKMELWMNINKKLKQRIGKHKSIGFKVVICTWKNGRCNTIE